MKNLWSVLFLTSFIILICRCTKDRKHFIEEEIVPFVDLFFREALERGLDINKRDYDFSVVFDNLENSGKCNRFSNTITIDRGTWNTIDSSSKEIIIFHEMGHCILERGHDDDFFEYRECKSYMNSDGYRSNICSMNIYSKLWREYYLDELFELDDKLPAWRYEEGPILNSEIYKETIIDTFISNAFMKKEIQLEGENYLLEITFTPISEGLFTSYWNGFNYQYCTNCPTQNLRIKNTALGPFLMYWSTFPQVESDVKLSIKKKGEILYFYFNSELQHVTENHAVDKNVLSIGNIARPESFSVAFKIF